MPNTEAIAVIDPFISLARRGTWAAIKLAEIGLAPPPEDIHKEDASILPDSPLG
jgi:hypothetical protein